MATKIQDIDAVHRSSSAHSSHSGHPSHSAPDELRRAQHARDEMNHFVRALSHDMGANFMIINHLFKQCRKIAEQYDDPELQENMSHIETCLVQSRSFLDDLVTLARTGTVDMEPEPVSLDELVREVLLQQCVLLKRRSIEVDVELPMPSVWASESRVRQIVTNLIRNAAKHGCDDRTPRIEVTARAVVSELSQTESSETEPRSVELRIYDNGIGIPEEHRLSIFDPGCRLPGTTADGSGFGLAIVQKIARHYGGDVRIESDGRPGTTFLVLLPLASAPKKCYDRSTDLLRIDHGSAHNPTERITPPRGIDIRNLEDL